MKYSESANLGLLEQAKPTGKPLISGEFGVGSKATNLVTKNKRITVLVVDDHPIVLDGLTAVIDNQPDMLVIAEASDGISAVVKYREHRPDVVVMDLRMPGLGGVGAILQIRREFQINRVHCCVTGALPVLAAFGALAIHRFFETPFIDRE